MLINSTRALHEEESALLRCKIAELNWNTIRLIAEAEKLIKESKQLSARIKSFENAREHESIVPRALWERVQTQLTSNLRKRRNRVRERASSL